MSVNWTQELLNREQKEKDEKHQKLESGTNKILEDVKDLRTRRASLPPGDPGIADIDKTLAEHQQAFRDLYHPIKNPGALAKLGGFLKQHITGQAPAVRPAPTAPVNGERLAQLGMDTSGALAKEPNPFELKKRALMATGVPEDEATRLATGQKDPKPANVKYGLVQGTLNGQPMTLQHGADGTWKTMGGSEVDEATVNSFVPTPKQSAALKVGSFGEFLQQAYGANPTADQIEDGRKRWAQAASGTTVGEHVIQVPQPDNTIKAFVVQTTSHKEFGAPSTPTTPGAAKSKARAGAGIVGGGQTVGGKLTSAQTDAQKKYYDAVKLSSQADQVAKNPNDAVNQKRLAVALERAAAGRFTTQALDYIIKAGWGNTLEQWAHNPSTGALPADVMRQLLDGAHQNLKASKDALDEAMKPAASSGAPAAPQSSGKAVSLAAAKRLPAMQGKTDDQIKAAIKAAGHEVAP